MRPVEAFLVFSLVFNLILYEAMRNSDRSYQRLEKITMEYYHEIDLLKHKLYQ